MMAAYRYPDHAMYTKVLIVKFPKANQLVNNSFLRCTTTELWYVARVFNHADDIEVGTKTIAHCKQEIENDMRGVSS